MVRTQTLMALCVLPAPDEAYTHQAVSLGAATGLGALLQTGAHGITEVTPGTAVGPRPALPAQWDKVAVNEMTKVQ